MVSAKTARITGELTLSVPLVMESGRSLPIFDASGVRVGELSVDTIEPVSGEELGLRERRVSEWLGLRW